MSLVQGVWRIDELIPQLEGTFSEAMLDLIVLVQNTPWNSLAFLTWLTLVQPKVDDHFKNDHEPMS